MCVCVHACVSGGSTYNCDFGPPPLRIINLTERRGSDSHLLGVWGTLEIKASGKIGGRCSHIMSWLVWIIAQKSMLYVSCDNDDEASVRVIGP